MIRMKAAGIGRAGLRGIRRHWLAITVPIALVVITAYAVAFMLDEPLRRYTEAKVNRASKLSTSIPLDARSIWKTWRSSRTSTPSRRCSESSA